MGGMVGVGPKSARARGRLCCTKDTQTVCDARFWGGKRGTP